MLKPNLTALVLAVRPPGLRSRVRVLASSRVQVPHHPLGETIRMQVPHCPLGEIGQLRGPPP